MPDRPVHGLSAALLACFVVTAPVEAADLTRSLLGRLAAASHNGMVVLNNLAT
ncbi:hypothetical protein [Saccharopolyspora hirsuta]|uniref:hypothetical protein n=1 Tax=Saccharopolyspora hirsuta TaxID=1837 RepID=UPI0014792DA5|nr:hypothetical protein [Saccharopolyspora hirsuta]